MNVAMRVLAAASLVGLFHQPAEAEPGGSGLYRKSAFHCHDPGVGGPPMTNCLYTGSCSRWGSNHGSVPRWVQLVLNVPRPLGGPSKPGGRLLETSLKLWAAMQI